MVSPQAQAAPGRRAVVLVGGPAAPYSRSIRIARALAAEGYAVEIAAVAAPGLAEREAVAPARPGTVGEPEPDPARVGGIELRRYRPSGPWAVVGASDAASAATPEAARPTGGPRRALRRAVRAVAAPILTLRRWLAWPHAVRGWWATLRRELPPADLYHACGSLTIAAALAARARSPIGPGGGPARVIYDAIDDVTESNEALALPGPVRRRNARTEAAWARAADAVVYRQRRARRAPRRSLAPRAIAACGRQSTRTSGPDSIPALLRRRTGSGPRRASHRRRGSFCSRGVSGPGLGLDEAAEAVLLVPDAALVLLGFGRGMAASLARDRDPRFDGRHVTLPARHPDELLAWTASADVALIPLPPISANQRLSSPNKFWEALAAGTPVVVVSGLEVMERLVGEHDLGVVAASTAPADLAAAIGRVLDRLDLEGAAWRERIATTSRERFGWPETASAYRSLVRSLGRAKDGGLGSQST